MFVDFCFVFEVGLVDDGRNANYRPNGFDTLWENLLKAGPCDGDILPDWFDLWVPGSEISESSLLGVELLLADSIRWPNLLSFRVFRLLSALLASKEVANMPDLKGLTFWTVIRGLCVAPLF